jgi:hypothetical protein
LPDSSVTEDGPVAAPTLSIRLERLDQGQKRFANMADIKAFLLTFDRAGLQGLVQDL